jgi:hypothetical protein
VEVLPTASSAILLLFLNPAGPVHNVVTVTGIFTSVLSSTVQAIVTSDAVGRIGLTGTLVMATDTGGGTVTIKVEIANHNYYLYALYALSL